MAKKTLIICETPITAPADRKVIKCDDIFDAIRREYPDEFPPTARLFHQQYAETFDITPRGNIDAAMARVRQMDGPFLLVIHPGDPTTIIVNLIIAAILTAAAYALTPKQSTPQIPGSAERKVDDASPNNAFSSRQNTVRVNGRIPDIFGTVRATPDLIGFPYSLFENNQEVEHSYMCLGRGEYDVDEIKDGDTLVEDIDGTSVEVYGPNTSPNSGSPQLTIGDAIGRDITKIGKLTAVNGQVLLVPNSGRLTRSGNYLSFATPNKIKNDGTDADGDALDFRDYFNAGDDVTIGGATFDNASIRSMTVDLTFESPNKINAAGGVFDFRDHYVVGRNLTITSAIYSDGTTSVNLAGTYTIASVAAGLITLSSPNAVNSDWNKLTLFAGNITGTVTGVGLSTPLVSIDLAGTYTISTLSAATINLSSPASINSDWNKLAFIPNGETEQLSSTLTPSFNRHVGPYVIADKEMSKVIVNVVAMSGLYRDNGTKQQAINLSLDIKLQKLNSDGSNHGSEEVHSVTMNGSAVSHGTIAKTFEIAPDGGAGWYKIRLQRTDSFNYTYVGTTVDEVKWRDCYSSSPIDQTDFGNVTTVQSKVKATERALSVKDRKLTMLASRKIKRRSGGGFTSTLFTTSDFDLILYHCALDPYIGRRTVGELDLTQIDAIADAVRAYFGDDQLAEFNYTFDKSELSFEETFRVIANAAFCEPYRRGNKLQLAFEKATENSTLLFNHRNKVPKSELRTYRFGTVKDFDGIEVQYVSPDDDAVVKYSIPVDGSAVAPRKIETVGLRNHKQPYVLAWREWNKMLYQNVTTKFDALAEAALCLPNDRILVADNTRPDTIDGEVIDQDVSTLELSQPVTLDALAAYTIHLQLPDGTVESFGVTQGADDRHVVIDGVPSLPLSLDKSNAARCAYTIIRDTDTRELPFLIAGREPKDNFTSSVTAINYSDRYYEEDLTFPT